MVKEVEKTSTGFIRHGDATRFQSPTLFELSLHTINNTIYNTWKESNKKNMKTQCCLTSRSFNLDKIYELDIPTFFKKRIHSTLFKTYNNECWDCEADEFRYQAELKAKISK